MLSLAKDKLLAAQIVAIAFMTGAKSQRGQASAEYIGIILVIAALIVGLVAAASAWGPAISTKVVTTINSIGG